MRTLALLAQSTALPPPPAPGSGHGVSPLSIVIVVLVVLGSAAMVSLSSRRFKRRSNDKSDVAGGAPASPSAPPTATAAGAQTQSDLLSRLHRVTEPTIERRRLGDRRPKTSAESDGEIETSFAPIEPVPSVEPRPQPARAVLSDDEPEFPEPIPIHRRATRFATREQATGRISGNAEPWAGSSGGSGIPGLSEEEIKFLEASRAEKQAAARRGSPAWPGVRESTPAASTELALANELSAIVRELLFCSNSGQLLHGFALYSDAFLFRTMDDSGLSESEFKEQHQNTPAKPIRDWTRLAELRGIERHADNVVTATAVYAPAPGSTESLRERFRFLKNEESHVWQIDDIEPID
jgi:hypothetical protein